MSLSTTILKNEILKVIDEDFNDFEGFPEEVEDAVLRWSTAIKTFYKDLAPVVAPPTAPLTEKVLEDARVELYNTWLPLFRSQSETFPSPLVLRFHEGIIGYLGSVVSDMDLIDTAYTWSAPSGVLLPFTPEFTLDQDRVAEDFAEEVAQKIFDWSVLGRYQLNVNPNTIVEWALLNPPV